MNIIKKSLSNIDVSDIFFDSLRNDYPGFNNWFLRRVSYRDYAYVSYDDNNKLYCKKGFEKIYGLELRK